MTLVKSCLLPEVLEDIKCQSNQTGSCQSCHAGSVVFTLCPSFSFSFCFVPTYFCGHHEDQCGQKECEEKLFHHFDLKYLKKKWIKELLQRSQLRWYYWGVMTSVRVESRVSVALGRLFTFSFHLRRRLSSRNSYLLPETMSSPLNNITLILITHSNCVQNSKGQLISKCLFEKIVWTKIPPKNLINSALEWVVWQYGL